MSCINLRHMKNRHRKRITYVRSWTFILNLLLEKYPKLQTTVTLNCDIHGEERFEVTDALINATYVLTIKVKERINLTIKIK